MNCYRLGLLRPFSYRAYNLAAHFRGAHCELGGFRYISGSIASVEDRRDRIFDAIGFGIQVERVAKHHRDRKDGP